MPSQVQNLLLPSSGQTWIEGANGETPQVGSVSSTISALAGEVPFTGQRGGAKTIQYTPPRRRTIFDIQNLTITLPVLYFGMEANSVSAELEARIGFLCQVIIGGTAIYTAPTTPLQRVLKGTAFQEFFKPPETQQLQFTQSLVALGGDSIELEINAYWEIVRSVNATQKSKITLFGGGFPATPINSTLVYDQRGYKGRQEK